MNARTAKKPQLSTYLNRVGCFSGLGVVFSCTTLHAQENVFRPVSIQLPAVTTVPTPGTAKSPEPENASKEKEDADKTKEAAKTSELITKNRDPIVLPSLSIPNTSIQGVGTGSTPEDLVLGRLPPRMSLPYGPDRYGFWALDTKTWTAPVFCHQPVYFEDTMLERHGHERFPCIQPLVSGTRFFTDVALLPYKSYLQRPLEERYNTGYYRPGSAAPGLRQRLPYDAGAMRFQLLTTGTVVLAGQP